MSVGDMMPKRIKTDAIGVILRQIRLEQNISQEELGRRMQFDRAYVAALESGSRYPSVDMLLGLAKALEVRPGEMLDRIAVYLDSGKARILSERQQYPEQNVEGIASK